MINEAQAQKAAARAKLDGAPAPNWCWPARASRQYRACLVPTFAAASGTAVQDWQRRYTLAFGGPAADWTPPQPPFI